MPEIAASNVTETSATLALTGLTPGHEYAVSIGGATATFTTKAPPPPALDVPAAGELVRVGATATRKVDVVNGFRAAGTLAVYTRTATQQASPANQWGVEAAVSAEGKVSDVRNRASGLPAMPIPLGGYVLSGHDAAASWLLQHAKVGTPVAVAGDAPQPPPAAAGRVLGVYWTGWTAGTRLVDLPDAYSLIYLFAAHPGGAAGAVRWSYGAVPVADLAAVRAEGKKVILSTGGAGGGISFDTRAKSQAFVDSVVAFRNAHSGHVDGVDFNTFEADAAPNLPEYLWMAQELKRRFGAGFLITSPPAPWSQRDKTFCAGMLKAGAMDYCAPQFYDGPGLEGADYIVSKTAEWVRDVAGGDASKIVVGFGVSQGAANYSTIAQCKDAWSRIEAAHPTIRGAFVWQHATDKALGWAFANQVGPLVKS